MGLEACTEDLSWTRKIQSWLATPQETETCPIAEGSLPTACPPLWKTLLRTLLPWAVAHPMGRCFQVQSSWKALRLARILSDPTACRHNFQELKLSGQLKDLCAMHDGTAFPHGMRIPGHRVVEIQARLSPCLQLIFYKLLSPQSFVRCFYCINY